MLNSVAADQSSYSNQLLFLNTWGASVDDFVPRFNKPTVKRELLSE